MFEYCGFVFGYSCCVPITSCKRCARLSQLCKPFQSRSHWEFPICTVFAPLEKWRRFFCLSLHRWEKDGVAYQKTLYYRSSTSTLNSAPSYSRTTHAPALLVRGFVSRKKGARSMGEEKKEGEKKKINMKKKEGKKITQIHARLFS